MQTLGSIRLNLNKDLWACRRRLKLTKSVSSVSGDCSFIWLKETNIKVSCFLWRAIQNRIPSNPVLKYRGINISLMICGECNMEEESADHLLCEYSFTRVTWEWSFRWCGISVPHFDETSEVLDFVAAWGNRR